MVYFMEPRGPRQPFLLAPWPVLFMIGLLALAYAVFAFAPAALQERLILDYAFIPARYSPAFLAASGVNPGTVLEQAVPFIGYIFMHGSLEHLAINSIWLLPFGAVVARRFGAALFFTFFLLCGVAGAAAHLACNWGSAVPVVGASAAISGLMGAAFRMMNAYDRSLAPILSPRILTWSAVWIGINVLAGLTGLGTGSTVQLIAWQAHIGGYFAGLLLAGIFAALADWRLERSQSGHR
ncbi:MAG: rhomboid family intramembrane serine protease [Alphaproteobacteria bacterium]|nr:rhomboid family intramembrane serine protease [Alphaproteobacteria bacterium]MBU6471821.1 rhomboid family intramembrane serine protease [Alphaproteobacteria bacterium]MDE2011683.1 rhomboid family intramembrane serine protease [Alphaproteobacteria bacterium]MDE2072553.1 rhomboid family intramembrane serine protease [Alphaproteobacteria bacterium]